MKKKLLYIGLGILAVIVIFIGYHFILYLKATSQMKGLSADLEQRIAEWEKKEYKRPPLFGPAVPGNAATFYQEAIKEKIEEPEELWGALYECVCENKPLKPELLEWAKSYKTRIDLLKNGANTESIKPLVHPRDKDCIKLLNFSTAKRLISDIVVILGKDLENNNKFSESIELYCTSIRFGDDYRFNGPFIQALVSTALSGIGQGKIQEVLLGDKLNEKELSKLIGYLKTLIDFYPSFKNIWESETVFMGVWQKEAAEKRGFILKKDVDFMACNIFTLTNRTDYVDLWKDSILLFNDVAKATTGHYAQSKDELNKVEALYKTSAVNILVGGIPS
ncbi:MAG: hypothetical protein V1701_05605, partial [Planctomycetota bacterium]